MIHDGSTEAVLDSLATFHLTRECLPNELGELVCLFILRVLPLMLQGSKPC